MTLTSDLVSRHQVWYISSYRVFHNKKTLSGCLSFKDISYLELWLLLCSVEQNNLCNFGREPQEKHSCEIILIWTSGSGDIDGGVYHFILGSL